jgi:hypothetical protein
MTTTHPFRPMLLLAAASALAMVSTVAAAQSSAASQCPGFSISPTNLALNPGFEMPAANARAGDTTCWQNGDPLPANAAAAGWLMHTSNDGARVCSRLVDSTTPGPNGRRMLAFRAGGNEGGVYQDVRGIVDPARAYMFSAWVFVRSGKVGMSGSNGVGGPTSFTTKIGEWEQLRVCTNSRAVTDILTIYNQDAAGGTFFVDRVELREIPIVE